MSYTYDADLEFLGECTDEQLKNLACYFNTFNKNIFFKLV